MIRMIEDRDDDPCWSRDPRFAEFVRLFDARRWFDAHEVLEGLWLETTGVDRDVLQGLIQLAVALEHAARGNPGGGRKLLASASARLERYGERRAGIALRDLADGVAAWLERRASSPPRLASSLPSPAVAPGVRSRGGIRTSRLETSMSGRPKEPRAAVRSATAQDRTVAGSAISAAKGPKRRPAVPSAAKRPPTRARRRTAIKTRTRGSVRHKAAAPARSAARRSTFRLEPLEVRRQRAGATLEILRTLYPEAGCELTHSSALALLVAPLLSAQCTDARVNMTTPALFARYRTASDFANAKPSELESIVRPTGFYKNKSKSIIALGKALVEKHGGEVPEGMEELVQLPGVGRKTANVLIAE